MQEGDKESAASEDHGEENEESLRRIFLCLRGDHQRGRYNSGKSGRTERLQCGSYGAMGGGIYVERLDIAALPERAGGQRQGGGGTARGNAGATAERAGNPVSHLTGPHPS